ncbi:SDR family oxidoreductase [Alteromonas halophila]|uniref:NAD-dependent epimerase n=1 Tax=Alteromonas halophila TaxID=516698 RepID=A0A918MZP5_9ALTE|nr:SDR family oxidoreductase [Alteromonas halophila]GGW93355.1 NAD-dependent epimerase [Alteromonas halophila]
MATILIIGASGQIGKQATKKLLDAGHHVRAPVRNPDKLDDIEHQNLAVMQQDYEKDFSEHFDGVDCVVFTAGSGAGTGPDKTLLIDLWAARNAVEYAKAAQVPRFIMVSSIGADDPDAVDSAIKPYLVAKHMADQHLIHSGLSHVILRPGSLLNEPGTHLVSGDMPANMDDAVIPREDVATAIVESVSRASSSNLVTYLFKGETPVSQLVE